MVNWTEEAEELLGAVPAFVRKQVRETVEKEARKEKRIEIDAAYLKAIQGEGGGRPGKSLSQPEITDDPIHEAFDRKYGVHATMLGGRPVEGGAENHFFDVLARPTSSAAAMAYIHIPFCCTRCLFCGFYSEATEAKAISDYAEVLVQDIVLAGSKLTQTDRQLGAVYFGGGTPTDLSAKELELLLKTVRRELPLADDCEITIEGRLYDFNDDKVRAALAAGANRFSFGVQSFDTKIRRQMGRVLGRKELIERLNRIVELGDPFNTAVIIDLIYGLPGQNEVKWLDSIDCAVNETAIHGLDLYQINLLPQTPLAKKLDSLPPMADMKEQADLFLAGRQRMLDLGFERLSVAHWGRDARERNRYNLWNKLNVDCVPMGAGSGGRWNGYRFFQQSDVHRYGKTVLDGCKPIVSVHAEEKSAPIIAAAIGQIEQQVVDVAALEKVAGHPFHGALMPLLGRWVSAGLLEIGEPCRLTPAGEFWSVNLQYLISQRINEVCS